LLVFGPNKMPEIARQVGKGMREFRRVQQHLRSELRDVVSEFDLPSGGGDGTPATAGIDPVPMLPAKDEPASSMPAIPTTPVGDAPAPEVTAPDAEPSSAAVDQPESN
jgi:sec-independent protein translocase protein TatB